MAGTSISISGIDTGATETDPEIVRRLVWVLDAPITKSVPLTPISAVTVRIWKRFFLDFFFSFPLILNCAFPVSRETLLVSLVIFPILKKEREESSINSGLPLILILTEVSLPVCTRSVVSRTNFAPGLRSKRVRLGPITLAEPFSSNSSPCCACSGIVKSTERNSTKSSKI